MDRILVATNFSVRSDRALRRATFVARRFGASLVLVHVAEPGPGGRWPDPAEAKGLLDETARTVSGVDGIDATAVVRTGVAHAEILAAADECSADLVVLGSHRERLMDALVDPVVTKVIRGAKAPTLVVSQTPAGAYERVLLPLDHDDNSRSAARAAIAFGLFENAHVVLMHAFDAPAATMLRREGGADASDDYLSGEHDEAASATRALVREIGLTAVDLRIVQTRGNVKRTIVEMAETERSDLVVMGASRHEGLARVFMGSVVDDVLRENVRDILVVPPSR